MLKTPVLQKMMDQLKEVNGAKIIVGVQKEPGINFHGHTVSASEDLCKIAYVHEFGYDIEVIPEMRAWLHHNGIHLKKDTTHIHIPERSFVRQAHKEGMAQFRQLKRELEGKVFTGKVTIDEMLDTLGRDAMTNTFDNLGHGSTPVTKYTLEHRKDSPNPTPLIDTGSGIQNHITYRVVKKGADSG